jgi:ABC-type multidrug transport system fused ATPase/permease subunit
MLDIWKKLVYLMDKEDKRNFIKFIFLLMIGGFVNMVGIGSIIPLIYLLINPDKLQGFPILNQFSYIQAVGLSSIFLILAFTIKNGVSFYTLKAQQAFLSFFSCKIRNQLFDAFIYSPYQVHVKRNTASLITIINSESGQLSSQLTAIGTVLNEMATSLFVLALLLWLNVIFTLVIVVSVFFTSFLFMKFMNKKGKYYNRLRIDCGKNLVQSLNQGLGGIKETKIYQKEHFFSDRAYAATRSMAKAQLYLSIYGMLPRFLIETVSITVILTMIFLFIASGYSGQQIMLLISVFGATSVQFLPSMNRLTQAFSQISFNLVSLDIVYQELKAAKSYILLKNRDSQKLEFKKQIELKNISYAYDDNKVLNKVNLVIPKGKRVALVGASGAGKTTLVDIFLGVLVPQEGQILVDGISITEENIIAEVYGSVVKAGIYKAGSIKVAEAAKVIENTQRDLNIAFVNELALICNRLKISVY